MANKAGVMRLNRELKQLLAEPVPNIVALPSKSNIFEWHYVITGPQGTPYEGGYYHGKIIFPSEYPHKPPSIMMLTPNGRFQTNKRLCLSMSDYHPETWNPLWSVSSILNGLLSFMLEDKHTVGSITSTDAEKRKFAKLSLGFNQQNPQFKKLFPEFAELQIQETNKENDTETNIVSPSATSQSILDSSLFLVCIIAAVLVALFTLGWQ